MRRSRAATPGLSSRPANPYIFSAMLNEVYNKRIIELAGNIP
jgi:hypothetical protein